MDRISKSQAGWTVEGGLGGSRKDLPEEPMVLSPSRRMRLPRVLR